MNDYNSVFSDGVVRSPPQAPLGFRFETFLTGIFNPEEPMLRLIDFQHYFEISTPVEISTGSILAEPTNKNFQKIDFFKIV